MTFKNILEGTIRRDAESWVRDLMTAEGYHIRLIEAENISYLGKNDQAVCHVEIWYEDSDQTGVTILYNMDAYGIHRASIWDKDSLKKPIWFEDSPYQTRKRYGIEHFVLTRREM